MYLDLQKQILVLRNIYSTFFITYSTLLKEINDIVLNLIIDIFYQYFRFKLKMYRLKAYTFFIINFLFFNNELLIVS